MVTLRADKTHENADADALLMFLGNEARAIPFLAVFPGDNPAQPFTLADVYTKKDVLDILRQCPDPPKKDVAQREAAVLAGR